MSKKIYCGIGKVPKGSKQGSMVECLEKGKVNLYGLHKIDSKLIKQKLASRKKTSKKDKEIKEMDLKLAQTGIKGKITSYNREIMSLEKEDDKFDTSRNGPLIKKIKKSIDLANNEIKKLSDLIKKMKDGKTVKVDLKAIDKKVLTVAEIKGEKKQSKK